MSRVAADQGPPSVAEGHLASGHSVDRLPVSGKARLAAEILVAYARVRWWLRRGDLPGVVERLRAKRATGRARPLADPARDGLRLGAAVVKTLEPLPLDSRCLTRSLVLLYVLARRGAEGSLVIAVRPSEDLALAAHAWVELEGRPLLAPAGDDHGRLVTL
jgi:hypothetical protein